MECRGTILMELTKVTKNFRITITKDARKALKIKAGDFVLVSASKNELIVRKV